MKIALDAMGGDYAPANIVEGAVLAAKEYGVEIILVGEEGAVSAELAKYKTEGVSISIVHASQVVDMHDSPSIVIRKKRDSSIWIATKLVKDKEAVAVISAGNTGAAMAAAFFVLGTIKGVERPAIAALLPTISGTTIMIDVGANVDCKAEHLFQFAIMGDIYAKYIYKKQNPKVGLLSIGAEATKGNEVTKEAFQYLKGSQLNFIGNVEGRDVYQGNADVIVCDGFIGNVALKISEGLADAIGKMLKKEIANTRFGRLGYMFLKPAFVNFRKRVDYSEYGGAPLLGVDGVSIISHGRSSAKAIKNAIKVAKEFHESRIIEHIQSDIAKSMNAYKEKEKKSGQKGAVK